MAKPRTIQASAAAAAVVSCLFAAAVSAHLRLAEAAPAADYPARPITLVVPYPAGGGNDVIGRLVAAKMSTSLGQPIVIENRAGAGSTIGTRDVARSKPDGYTLLIATSSLAINPFSNPIREVNPLFNAPAECPVLVEAVVAWIGRRGRILTQVRRGRCAAACGCKSRYTNQR